MARKKHKNKTSLEEVLTILEIKELAGSRYYGRGYDYFEDGAVGSLKERDGVLSAKVDGSITYKVQLWAEDGELEHECSCPLGQEYAFCKHCVAVGLAWLHKDQELSQEEKEKKNSDSIGEKDVRDFLMGKSKEALVEMLLEQCEEDDRLNRRLLALTAKTNRDTLDPSVWKDALDEVVWSDDFVDWRRMSDYSSEIGEVVDSIEELLHEGNSEAVIEITEHGLAVMERAMEQVDDSGGNMGMLVEDLKEIHLNACRKVRLDPVLLAERLFNWELSGEWGTFSHAAETYADVLGEAGLARYRELTEKAWANIKPLGPRGRDSERYDSKRYRVTSMMESLAKTSGDVEQLVAIKSRDLSHAYNYLTIAEIYRKDGQKEKALEWAEKGWKAFSNERRDDRLREFITDAYHRAGRHDEAMVMTWEAFQDRPSFDRYQDLAKNAKRADTWPEWREKALTLIRKEISDSKKRSGGQRGLGASPLDHSTLVSVFLWEKDREAAWQEAREGGCSGYLWLELAELREKIDPYNSVQIYREHIRILLKRADKQNYVESVQYLGKIKKLLKAMGKPEDFGPIVAGVRAEHKRKKNLMALLDKKKW
ncbi:MAG: SWIM zinc finger family protein [Magnetococcales bacterium]|nr:SWIM zinc finger family protein [Magnetococcales bacterium]